MRNHRTTFQGALLLILTALGLGVTSASQALDIEPGGPPAGEATMIFPVVGMANYTDDWGDPRGQGRHQGNDILTTWRSPAVAAEDGKIKFWTTSARAGCMLYLYGASGTTYLYIHLNNDNTSKRDNRGACVPGIAYATGLKNGSRVKAGQLIAYNGDSGDAEGIYHLHFEVHPHDGTDVDPFPYLNTARRLLFPLPAKRGNAVTLGLKGSPVSAGARALELLVTSVRVWPGGSWVTIPARSIQLSVPEDALVDESLATAIASPTPTPIGGVGARPAVVFTRPARATVDAATGAPGALVVDRVRPT